MTSMEDSDLKERYRLLDERCKRLEQENQELLDMRDLLRGLAGLMAKKRPSKRAQLADEWDALMPSQRLNGPTP